MSKIFFISSGKKNAMYTLRIAHIANGFMRETYICNLSTDAAKATQKAQDYVERVRDRFESANTTVQFDGEPDFSLFTRRGHLSTKVSSYILQIENGLFPFGKYVGQAIANAPDSYILYFADKAGDNDAVTEALAHACLGVALERDLIAKREVVREERRQIDAQSNFIGSVGDRVEIEGEVVSLFFKESFNGSYWINKIRTADAALVTYMGKKIAERGEHIKASFGIKAHSEYQGVKSTLVCRPTKVKVG